ncbi:ABC transporter permease [Aestuariimicrobium ganziense]|uniref:ABC transporter permease n=1 Tax=Aestuariimicrobium ganziense TaxID=2773677 RepID=UPI0019430E5A|nr:ABC transporter permease [Aestuariimicrobium ganziense]
MSESIGSAGRRIRLPWSDVVVTLFAFILAFLLGAVLMVVSDPEIAPKWSYFFSRPSDALGASWDKVSQAYSALVGGALGGIGPITSTLARSAPLICAGLGIGLAFRAGLFNIGAQGQAVVGAMISALVGFSIKGLPLAVHLPLAVLAGVAAGAAWGGIAGALKARAGAHEVITTIMLNYIALGMLGWALTTTLFQRPGRADPISPIVEWSATFPRIEGTQLHMGFVLALLAAFGVWWLMERTKLGFQIRAVGSNPSASATAGMSVSTITATTMAISGGLAGLAGVQVALGAISGATPTPLTAGLVGSIGFDAITVALLGRSRPLGTVLAGLLFGAMNTGGLKMQSAAQTPPDLIMVLQALIVLFVGAPMLVRTLVPFLKARRAGKAPTTQAVAPVASQGGLAS